MGLTFIAIVKGPCINGHPGFQFSQKGLEWCHADVIADVIASQHNGHVHFLQLTSNSSCMKN